MGKSYDGKKRWNETVRQTAAALAAADSRRSKHGAASKKKASDKRVSGACSAALTPCKQRRNAR
jgi:hypothetical protein